jgi:hypothetical protein
MKVTDLPPAMVQQNLYCPGCGYALEIPGPLVASREHVYGGGVLLLHCKHCQEVCQGRAYVPQAGVHEVNQLRGEIRALRLRVETSP